MMTVGRWERSCSGIGMCIQLWSRPACNEDRAPLQLPLIRAMCNVSRFGKSAALGPHAKLSTVRIKLEDVFGTCTQ